MNPERDERSLEGRLLADRYEVARVVSSGANTVILDAIDRSADRPVTVKLVRPELAQSSEFRHKFGRLAELSNALTHPNIASVVDWGEIEVDGASTVFWSVAALGGGSMRDLLDRGRLLSPGQALVVGLEACRALDAAHQKGLFHTELTPSKMVFGADRRLRIVDFGLARLLGEPSWADLASVPTHVARYASPEQALALPIDAKTDVYALSLVLVESVTGAVPFDADSTQATLASRIDKLLPVSADLGALASVLERAARPEAIDRFTAAEFGRALVQAAGKLAKPEPIPILATGLFDTTAMRRPSDPTGGVERPATTNGTPATADDEDSSSDIDSSSDSDSSVESDSSEAVDASDDDSGVGAGAAAAVTVAAAAGAALAATAETAETAGTAVGAPAGAPSMQSGDDADASSDRDDEPGESSSDDAGVAHDDEPGESSSDDAGVAHDDDEPGESSSDDAGVAHDDDEPGESSSDDAGVAHDDEPGESSSDDAGVAHDDGEPEAARADGPAALDDVDEANDGAASSEGDDGAVEPSTAIDADLPTQRVEAVDSDADADAEAGADEPDTEPETQPSTDPTDAPSDDLRIVGEESDEPVAGPHGTAQMPAAVAAAAATATTPTEALGVTPSGGPVLFEDPDFVEPRDGTGEIYDDRTRRRAGPIVLLVVLVLAGLGGLAYAGTLLFQTRSFAVPELAGVSEGVARNQIEGNDWTILTERERSDAFPEPDTVIRTDPGPGIELDEGESITLVLSDGFEFRTLPDVTGLTVDAAGVELEALRLQVSEATEREFSEDVPDGVVISWQVLGDATLQAGAQILPGESIELTVSMGPAPRDVPDLSGLTLDEATANLAGLRLEISVGEELFSDDVEIGRIITQNPAPGVQVERGGTVIVQASKGPDFVALPDLEGLTYTEAEVLLTDLGFEIGTLLGTTDGTFVQLTIDGEEVPPGTEFRRGQVVDVIFL